MLRAVLLLSLLLPALASAEVIALPPTDGVTDAAPSIQAAIDSCSHGCVVKIPDLDMRIASSVHVTEGVTLRGEGYGTRLRIDGNICGLKVYGSMVTIERMRIESVAPQSSGCGISFTHADYNVTVADIIFGHYLATGIDVAPNVEARGVYQIRHVRWNGVLGSGVGIRIGDGVHHLSDVRIEQISGTASTPADMGVWVDVLGNTDTIAIDGVTLIKGGFGVRVAYGSGTPAAVTGFTLTNAQAIESMTDYGVWVQSANNVRINNLSSAQNRGGLAIGSGVRGLSLSGSTLHANKGDGLTMFSGASGANLFGNLIADNNTAGSLWGFGISIGGGVSDFTIANNRIGNGLLWGGGFQRYCIFLASGPSNRYSITGNACVGHTSGDVVDGGSGTRKVVSGNF